MDREELDRQLKEQGKNIELQTDKFSSGRKKLAAAAVVLLITGFIGGCFFGDIIPGNKQGNKAESSYSFPQTEQKKVEELPAIRNTAVVQAVKEVGPAVVGITTRVYDKDIFNRRVAVGQSVGSGVIFRSDGYIVTNNHVISGAKEIIVSLADGRSLKGKLIGQDEFTDLAVVKVDEDNLPTAVFGDSDGVVVGEPAIAIGNPMGLEFQGSVTAGVISALNRTLDISDKRVKLFQTDAAISPGNSGGALVNADGEVIGINSAKVAASGVEGMGFSIPINTVQTIVNELIEKGYVARPYLGVSVFDPDTAARYGYQLNIDKGVYIFRLTLDGPCGKAGFQRGDISLEINGEEVNSVADLRNKIASYKVGDKVAVTYERNGTKNKAEVVLEEMPQEDR